MQGAREYRTGSDVFICLCSQRDAYSRRVGVILREQGGFYAYLRARRRVPLRRLCRVLGPCHDFGQCRHVVRLFLFRRLLVVLSYSALFLLYISCCRSFQAVCRRGCHEQVRTDLLSRILVVLLLYYVILQCHDPTQPLFMEQGFRLDAQRRAA